MLLWVSLIYCFQLWPSRSWCGPTVVTHSLSQPWRARLHWCQISYCHKQRNFVSPYASLMGYVRIALGYIVKNGIVPS